MYVVTKLSQIPEEIKETILPQAETLVKQTGDPLEDILADVERRYTMFVERGIDEKKAAKTAISATRASYTQLIRLGAVMLEGFFIGATAKVDNNRRVRLQTQEYLDEFKKDAGNLWKPKAIAEGLIDESGELIYSRWYLDEHANGNERLEWRIGKTLKEDNQKSGYAFVRPVDTDDEYEFVTCYIRSPDEFAPEFGKYYKFRAVPKENASGKNLTFHASISKLHNYGSISFEDVESIIGSELIDNVKFFDEAYDTENNIGVMPDNPAPKFCITNAVVGAIEYTSYGTVKVSVIDQNSDFDDIVELEMAKEYAETMCDNAIGIVIYRPFFRTIKNSQAKYPAGSMLGFIDDPAFRPDFDSYIGDYQEEY